MSIVFHGLSCFLHLCNIVDGAASVSPIANVTYGNCSSCVGEGVKTRYSKIRIGATNAGLSQRGGEQSTKCREKEEINKFGKTIN